MYFKTSGLVEEFIAFKSHLFVDNICTKEEKVWGRNRHVTIITDTEAENLGRTPVTTCMQVFFSPLPVGVLIIGCSSVVAIGSIHIVACEWYMEGKL